LIEAIPEGATLLGDKGYDSIAIRDAAAARNIWANIPNRSNRKQRFGFSSWLYRQRNLVERFFNRIRQGCGQLSRGDQARLHTPVVQRIMSPRPSSTSSTSSTSSSAGGTNTGSTSTGGGNSNGGGNQRRERQEALIPNSQHLRVNGFYIRPETAHHPACGEG
jgi:transposase